jgi:tRNA U34 5-carboxymethylaminomethyl modifying enzyme MnmG/GidA
MNQNGKKPETGENSERSTYSSKLDGNSCPKVFEEIIQKLEADIRKHIRIEHQLKLHIESTEDRIEELEREQDKSKPFSTDAFSDISDVEKLTKEMS